MRQHLFLLALLITIPLIGRSQKIQNDTIKVYFLGGQSNMSGHGFNKELPKDLKNTFDDVHIYQGNAVEDENISGGLGVWSRLKPGHGSGFSSNGKENKLSNRFGVELSFSKRIKELYPNDKIALIKYARGGSSLDSLAAGKFGSWEPDYIGSHGINQYDHFLTTLRGALNTDDIDGDGRKDYLKPMGIIWMQGESDAAYTEEIANGYYHNLKRLMDLIRASLRTDDLPVVIGKISDSWNNEAKKVWKYGELVQFAQEKYARTEENATIVRDTRYYKYSDPWHYDSQGYIDLGIKFADAIFQVRK